MIHKVLVDGVALLRFPKVYPCRLDGNGTVALLQKQNVGDHARTRVGKKGIVRQADCPQELRPFCNVLANRRILFVHRTRRGNERHHAAGTHFVQSFGKKVVVN